MFENKQTNKQANKQKQNKRRRVFLFCFCFLFLFFTAFSWETDLWVTLGDFTVKTQICEGESVSNWKIDYV